MLHAQCEEKTSDGDYMKISTENPTSNGNDGGDDNNDDIDDDKLKQILKHNSKNKGDSKVPTTSMNINGKHLTPREPYTPDEGWLTAKSKRSPETKEPVAVVTIPKRRLSPNGTGNSIRLKSYPSSNTRKQDK